MNVKGKVFGKMVLKDKDLTARMEESLK